MVRAASLEAAHQQKNWGERRSRMLERRPLFFQGFDANLVKAFDLEQTHWKNRGIECPLC